MQLIGGLRTGICPGGDNSFYANLFARMTKEVSNTGSLTRYVAFDYLSNERDSITFLGIEVDGIENIPDGMIAWDLDGSSLTVLETKNGENSIIWQENVVWQWRDESPSSCGRGVTGEFGVRVPLEWSGKSFSAYRHFSMTGNAYVAPGQTGCDDDVQLVDYDPTWPGKFKEFSDWLGEHFGADVALKIEHFGSTSISGMIAKPVIDVLVKVPSFPEAKQRALPCLNNERWEYWWHDDHIVFVRRDRLMGLRTHHVHMMPEGNELQNRLAFRDHLRSHAEDARRYATLKRQLAESHQTNREYYTDAKASFVREIIAKAMGNS